MRKILVLLTVVVGIFGFSSGAFSEVCSSCKGGDTLRGIPCDVVEQGDEDCNYFDYDENVGYCAPTSANYRAIFSVCECPDPTGDFKFFPAEGQVLGVRMTILVDGAEGENGAYWSAPADANIAFGMFSSTTEACAATVQDRLFGAGKFYKSDCITEVAALAADPACTVPVANQATKILTDMDQGYTVTALDELDKLSHWWIDIPPIRIDRTVLHNGETISVKIELLNQASGGICAACTSVCDCTIAVAKVCCYAVSGSSKLTFPYFTSITAGNWWNGIVILNKSSVSGTATLTAQEQDGSVGTATVNVPAKSMFVDLLSNITWSGTDLGNSPCYITVIPDYGERDDLDGFAMMGNGTEAQGYLPRRCSDY